MMIRNIGVIVVVLTVLTSTNSKPVSSESQGKPHETSTFKSNEIDFPRLFKLKETDPANFKTLVAKIGSRKMGVDDYLSEEFLAQEVVSKSLLETLNATKKKWTHTTYDRFANLTVRDFKQIHLGANSDDASKVEVASYANLKIRTSTSYDARIDHKDCLSSIKDQVQF